MLRLNYRLMWLTFLVFPGPQWRRHLERRDISVGIVQREENATRQLKVLIYRTRH